MMDTLRKYLNIHEDKMYLRLAISFFIVWIFCTGPLRWIVKTDSDFLRLLLGVAPNFFAGITLFFWQTYMTSSRPVLALLLAVAILALVEIVQMFMPSHRADLLDVIAAILGGLVAMIIAIRRSKIAIGRGVE
ncbi:MAG: hypothetical protein EOO50_10565 [Flavobacterium sp.]|nr:MAG: hypothetical protein EOO50_10565 [Flavobacterium sp.]